MTVAEDSENPCSRWLVLVACFVSHMTTASMSYHSGVLHVTLLQTFRHDVITTAWLGSVYSSIPSLIGPVASLVITTFDCRTCLIMSGVLSAVGASSCFFITQFYLIYPALILAGIGQGFSLIASYVAIGYNFPYQAGLLTGICVCGSGLGIFIHPPLLQTLVDSFGFHGAMLVLGAVSLHAVACGLAVPPSRYEKQRKRQQQQQRQLVCKQQRAHAETGDGGDDDDEDAGGDDDTDDNVVTAASSAPPSSRNKSHRRCCFFSSFSPRFSSSSSFTSSSSYHASFRSIKGVLSDFRFLLLLLTALGFSSAMACYYLYLPAFLLVHRYDRLTASFVMSVTGMGSIPARLLTGVVTKDPAAGLDTTTFFFGIHALAAVTTLLVPFTARSLTWQMILAALFGVYTGAVWASCSPLLLELLGVRRVAHGVGLYFFTMGLGYLAGPPLAGRLLVSAAPNGGGFQHVFYFTAAMFAMASAAAMLSTLIRPRKEQHRPSPRNELCHQSMDTIVREVTSNLVQQTEDPLLPSRHDSAAHDVIVVAEINPQTL